MGKQTDITTVAETENPLAHLPPELQEKILAARQQIEESSAISINRVSFTATKYKLPDGSETDTFVGIIVGAKHANVHYATEYNRDEVQPPDCVAIMPKGKDAACADLVPASFVVSKYSEKCADCTQFQFGSKGKGKACFEHTLLALYVPSIGEQLILLEARKGNSRTADNYLRNVASKYGHPMAVLTRFTIGAKRDWVQDYEFENVVAPELIQNVSQRLDEAEDMLYERVAGTYRVPATNDGGTENTEQGSGRKVRKR